MKPKLCMTPNLVDGQWCFWGSILWCTHQWAFKHRWTVWELHTTYILVAESSCHHKQDPTKHDQARPSNCNTVARQLLYSIAGGHATQQLPNPCLQVILNAVHAIRHLRQLGCTDIEFTPEDASECSTSLLCAA